MKKHIFTLFCALFCLHSLLVKAQTGIQQEGTDSLLFYSGGNKLVTISPDGQFRFGNTGPFNSNAVLQLNSNTKGVLLPRVPAATIAAMTGIPAGMILFNSNSNKYMVFNGSGWENLLSSAGTGIAWQTAGNAGTVDGTDFIGTTDNVPFNIRVNNEPSGKIDHLLENTFLGYRSGFTNSGGIKNTGIGAYSLYYNSNGYRNTAIGFEALINNNAGYENTSIGYESLYNNSIGAYNVAVGDYSLFSNTSGSGSTAVGTGALYTNSSSDNTAVGRDALSLNSTGSQNTAIGYSSGTTLTAANANVSGSSNTFVGYNTGFDSPVQRNNAAAIGANAKVDADNALILGGTGANAVNVGIGLTIPEALLHLHNSAGNQLKLGNVNQPLLEYYWDVDASANLGLWNENNGVPLSGLYISNVGDIGFGTSSIAANTKMHITTDNNNGNKIVLESTFGSPRVDLTFTQSSLDKFGIINEGTQFRMQDWTTGGGAYTFLSILEGSKQLVLDYTGTGFVGIGGAPSGSYKLEVNGTFHSTGITESSDVRWKKDIKPIDNALSKVSRLRGVTYNWRKDEFADKKFSDKNQLGLIAQEVEAIVPQVVNTDVNGFKSVEYSKLVALLIEAIKEQEKKINALENENKSLKASSQQQLGELKVELSTLIKRFDAVDGGEKSTLIKK